MSETPPKDPSLRAGGGCLCGAVRFEVRGDLAPVEICHCGQCRRFHGHVGAYTGAKRGALVFRKSAGLRWYDSSDKARRGFCGICGSSLFYEGHAGTGVAIAAGAIDAPTGLATVRHIFVASKGDYYDIADGLPQLAVE
jgi:hypothetical protein